MDQQHTPLPWHLGNDQTTVYGPDKYEIADPAQGPHCAQSYLEGDGKGHWATLPNGHREMAEEEEAANAAFIVRACNLHYEILEALKSCEAMLAQLGMGHDLAAMKARVAITKAEGK